MTETFSALDTNFWSLDTPTTHQAICAFCPTDTVPNVDEIRDRFPEVLKRFPRLKKKVFDDGRTLRWEEDSTFSLVEHIKHIEVPGASSIEELQEKASELLSNGVPLDKPLWSIFILSNQSSANESCESVSAVFYLLHHCFADGVGALEVLYSFSSDLKRRSREINPSTDQKSSSAKDKLKSLLTLIREALTPKGKFLLTGENSTQRVLKSRAIPLEEFHALKNRLGVTLNELYLTGVTGALRLYQQKHGAEIQDLRVIMPVSLRPRESQFGLGNYLTAVGIMLPTASSGTLERLSRTRSAVLEIKEEGRLGAYALLGKINAKLPRFLQRPICEAQARRSNLICTHIPSPKRPFTLGGAKIKYCFGYPALLRNHGIAFGFVPYTKQACLSLVYDPSIAPDAPILLDLFEDALSELRGS